MREKGIEQRLSDCRLRLRDHCLAMCTRQSQASGVSCHHPVVHPVVALCLLLSLLRSLFSSPTLASLLRLSSHSCGSFFSIIHSSFYLLLSIHLFSPTHALHSLSLSLPFILATIIGCALCARQREELVFHRFSRLPPASLSSPVLLSHSRVSDEARVKRGVRGRDERFPIKRSF